MGCLEGPQAQETLLSWILGTELQEESTKTGLPLENLPVSELHNAVEAGRAGLRPLAQQVE